MYKTITEEMFIEDILEVGDFDNLDVIKVMYRYMESEYDVKHYDPTQISKKFILLSRDELLHSIFYTKDLRYYAEDFSLGNIEEMKTEELFNLFADINNYNLVYRVDEWSYLIDKDYMMGQWNY
jgi:hypothetical protein